MEDWMVFVAFYEGRPGNAYEVDATNKDPEKVEGRKIVWAQGKCTQEGAMKLKSSLSEFTQDQLAVFVEKMNQPAVEIVFKEKKS